MVNPAFLMPSALARNGCISREKHASHFSTNFTPRALSRPFLAKRRNDTCFQNRHNERTQSIPLMNTLPSTESAAAVSLILADTSLPLQAGLLLVGPLLNIFNFVMVVRIILTWYPQTNLTKAPWIFLAVPTEPLLRATRKVIQPIGGVDISPIVWFAIGSFAHEILVGQQGLLILLSQK